MLILILIDVGHLPLTLKKFRMIKIAPHQILTRVVYFAVLSDNVFKFQAKEPHPFPCIRIFDNF